MVPTKSMVSKATKMEAKLMLGSDKAIIGAIGIILLGIIVSILIG
jgi:hypothetical protein